MVEISIERDENNRLIVTIYTDQLIMESITPLRIDDYIQLFAKKENMDTFADGKPLLPEQTATRIQVWIERWMNNDPFSAFSISKNDADDFIGYAILGHNSSKPGSAELSYVLNKKYWGKGFGNESITTIVKEYAPELAKRDYKVNKNIFTSITASARDDNTASCAILKKSGLKLMREDISFGHRRLFFFAEVKDVAKEQDKKAVQSNGSLDAQVSHKP